MKKVYYYLLALSSHLSPAMEADTQWLVRPSRASISEYAVFYDKIFNEHLGKARVRTLYNYHRTRILEKSTSSPSALADASNFYHEFRCGVYKLGISVREDIRAVSYILSGIKIDSSLNPTFWEDESPLHKAVRKQDNKMVIAALLLQGADTSSLNYEGKTPLQVIKKLALRDTQFNHYEHALKRYIWHKHVLLRKRFREKWGAPFANVPADVVGLIAHRAYGSYK